MNAPAEDALDADGKRPARREYDSADIRARLDAGEIRMAAIEARLDQSDRTQVELKEELARNTKATNDVLDVLTTVRDIMTAAKAGLKVMGWIGGLAKWLSIVVGAGTTMYVAIQTWQGKPIIPSSANVQVPRSSGTPDIPAPK